MTKTDLVKHVAGKPFNTQKEAAEAVDAMIEGITNALTSGDNVKLAGFGTFKVIILKARKARNPITGETIDVPAKKKVKFDMAKELKKRLS